PYWTVSGAGARPRSSVRTTSGGGRRDRVGRLSQAVEHATALAAEKRCPRCVAVHQQHVVSVQIADGQIRLDGSGLTSRTTATDHVPGLIVAEYCRTSGDRPAYERGAHSDDPLHMLVVWQA